ncbi:MAG TPA: tyrosinase family protein [Streptosporangiaceae bacterium]
MAEAFVRADIWTLAAGDPIVTAYRKAVAAMQAKPANHPASWAYQAAIHGSIAASPPAYANQCRHGTWFFLAWHRMYLYYFERIVRAQVIADGGPANWALPYWNYDGGGGHNSLPTAFRAPTSADGTHNALYVAERNPGINAGAGLRPLVTSAAKALARPSFTGDTEFGGGITPALGQFWAQYGQLEMTPHNAVHDSIGGLMGDPDTAAQDPIFWLHHANIDRLWWQWSQHHTDPTDKRWTAQSFSFIDANGKAAALTCAHVKNISTLGYSYVQPAAQAPAPAPPPSPAPPPAPGAPAAPGLPPGAQEGAAMAWPSPWPARPAAPLPDTGEPAVRQLLGATTQPVQLVGSAVTVPVTIDDRAAALAAAAQPAQHRAFLDFEDIEAARNPGQVYGVFVNLPDQPGDADLAAHHVGNISLFGVERASNPRGDQQPHGLRASLEITGLLDQLAADGSWQDGHQLMVTLAPITLEPPPGQPELAAELAATAHPDLPITIGRISVFYA